MACATGGDRRNAQGAVLCRSLSNWEVVEAYWHYLRGVSTPKLASSYGVSSKTFMRAFRRLEAMAS